MPNVIDPDLLRPTAEDGAAAQLAEAVELIIAVINEGLAGGSGGVVTNYVATGAEGTDFMVTLSQEMDNDDYGLVWSPAGVASVPVLDLPNLLAGDRTTTQFRVTLAAALTAGDQLTFVAFAQS